MLFNKELTRVFSSFHYIPSKFFCLKEERKSPYLKKEREKENEIQRKKKGNGKKLSKKEEESDEERKNSYNCEKGNKNVDKRKKDTMKLGVVQIHHRDGKKRKEMVRFHKTAL